MVYLHLLNQIMALTLLGPLKSFENLHLCWKKLQVFIHIEPSVFFIGSLTNPSAPHFGGAWERLVWSCKKAMFAVWSSCRLTEETLSTTMCLFEQILIARPLTAISADSQNLEALTPNLFDLIAWLSFCLSALLYLQIFHIAVLLNKPNRTLTGYVPQLQRRSKWVSDSSCPLVVGSLVRIVDTDSPRGSYPLGDDGRVRSAILKTNSDSLVCPLVKLVLLPVFSSCDQEGPDMFGTRIKFIRLS